MRLSTIFELLLIFLFIAFAASRHIDKKQGNKKISQKQNPPSRYCTCSSLKCNCCRNFSLPVVSIKGPGCARITYLTGDSMRLTMSFGDRVLRDITLSGRRPKPVCMGLPGGVSKFCGRIYGIEKDGEERFKACLALELRALDDIEAALRVSCFNFGPEGVRLEPSQPIPKPSKTEEEDEDDDDDDDDYGLLADDDDDDDDDDEEEEDEDSEENDVDSGDYGGFSFLGEEFLEGFFGGGGGGSSSSITGIKKRKGTTEGTPSGAVVTPPTKTRTTTEKSTPAVPEVESESSGGATDKTEAVTEVSKENAESGEEEGEEEESEEDEGAKEEENEESSTLESTTKNAIEKEVVENETEKPHTKAAQSEDELEDEENDDLAGDDEEDEEEEEEEEEEEDDEETERERTLERFPGLADLIRNPFKSRHQDLPPYRSSRTHRRMRID